MIVITIIAILSIGGYIPYSYYSQLSSVRTSSQIVNQSVNDARIMANNGFTFPRTNTNANVLLKFVQDASTIDVYALSGTTVVADGNPAIVKIRSIPLEKNVVITSLTTSPLYLLFRTPDGTLEQYDNNGNKLTTDQTVRITWENAKQGSPLSREIIVR